MLLALRNRPHAERRALMLLRGETLAVVGRSRRTRTELIPNTEQLCRFADLRRAAGEYGLAIQSPAMPYVGKDELRMLAWLAEGQRIASPSTMPDAPKLAAAIVTCAALLDRMSLRLSPLTLYGARLRQLTG